MSDKDYSYRVMVLGTEAYDTVFRNAIRGLPEYVRLNYGVNLKLYYDFFEFHSEAWERAQSGPHDIYFVDAGIDGLVSGNKSFSESVRELYPSPFVVGMSAMMQFIPKDEEAKRRYHFIMGFHPFISEKDIAFVLRKGFFIPQDKLTPQELEMQFDKKIDRLKSHPQANKFMEEEGY